MTKNACVVVKRVPAPKTGGLLAKIKAIEAAAALQSTATYDIPPLDKLYRCWVTVDGILPRSIHGCAFAFVRLFMRRTQACVFLCI